MRVAFTSSDGERVDEHFGQATHFHVWEVGPETAEFVQIVGAFGIGRAQGQSAEPAPERAGGLGGTSLTRPPQQESEEDRIAARANAVQGCALVYTEAIGGPAAAKLVARRIHTIKTGRRRALPGDEAVPIAELVEQLQGVLRGRPPPWLRKALGMGAVAVPTAEEEET